jgi:hypothetical protein
MSRLLVAQSSAQHPGEAEQRGIAAREAIRPAIGADQFALDAKRSGLKRNEMNVLESSAVNGLTEHACVSLRSPQENLVSHDKHGWRDEEVAALVPGCGKNG